MLSTCQWIAITKARGLGRKRLAKIALALRDEGITERHAAEAGPAVFSSLGVPSGQAQELVEALASSDKYDHLAEDFEVITPDDLNFPVARLSQALPPPVVFWTIGNTRLLGTPAIAVSGARRAPKQALSYARHLGAALTSAGFNVVTGNAAGVDRSAAQGALESDGTTTAVLAEGLARARARTKDHEGSELLVSEFEPNAPWAGFRAMERNQTIAALADAVIVVAAGLEGGSWEQAKVCLRHGVPLGVPDFDQEVAPGNRTLILRGAIPLDPSAPADAAQRLIDEAQTTATLF